jgi:hypothetical protein
MLKWTEQDLADAGAERLPLGRPTEEWSYSDLDAGFKGAVLVLDETFVVQSTGHHPMETRSAMASWQNGKLYLYGSTQSVAQTRAAIAQWVGIDAGDVVLICEYTGGVFPPHLLERTQGRRVRRHQHLPSRTTDRRRGRRSDNEAEGADRLADCLSGRHNRQAELVDGKAAVEAGSRRATQTRGCSPSRSNGVRRQRNRHEEHKARDGSDAGDGDTDDGECR